MRNQSDRELNIGDVFAFGLWAAALVGARTCVAVHRGIARNIVGRAGNITV